MALQLIYPVMTRIFAWMRLAVQDSTAKNIEILILRHQLAAAQQRDPLLARKLTWADRMAGAADTATPIRPTAEDPADRYHEHAAALAPRPTAPPLGPPLAAREASSPAGSRTDLAAGDHEHRHHQGVEGDGSLLHRVSPARPETWSTCVDDTQQDGPARPH